MKPLRYLFLLLGMVAVGQKLVAQPNWHFGVYAQYELDVPNLRSLQTKGIVPGIQLGLELEYPKSSVSIYATSRWERLREIDRRVRYLRKRIEDAVVVRSDEQPDHNHIFFGATVTYVNSRDEEKTIRIVGEDEADSLNGKISWISPVARALMKSGVGDVVTVRTPSGEDELEVLEISYPA